MPLLSQSNATPDLLAAAAFRHQTAAPSGGEESTPTITTKNGVEIFYKDWGLAANRSQFYYEVAAGPFYGYNKPGAKAQESVVWNWWRQGMMGGAKAHYDGIVAFSQTDFTEDLKRINVPTLVMHSEDDQIVPYVASGPLSAKLLKHGTLKTYQGFPHGMPTTEAATINADLFTFIKGAASAASW